MSLTASDLLESARQLPPEDRQSLLFSLLKEEETEWQKELGTPEPDHSEWFAGRVTKAMEDTTPGISTEEAMSRARTAIRNAVVKQSA